MTAKSVLERSGGKPGSGERYPATFKPPDRGGNLGDRDQGERQTRMKLFAARSQPAFS
jgi:hypothetical protein